MRRTVLALTAGLLVLAACSGGDDEQPRTLTAQRDGAYEQPASCASLDVRAGATLTGEALAACMDDALAAHVTGRQTLFAGQADGVVSVTYSLGDPIGYESGGSQDLVVIGDDVWMRLQGDWVAGDPDGDETAQRVAAFADELDDDFVVNTEHVRAGGRWTVGRPRDVALRQGGTVPDAWPVSVAAPYEPAELVQVRKHVVWLDRTLTPVKVETDAVLDGAQARGGTELHDLGEKITITAPR